jgi:hypothetical protein
MRLPATGHNHIVPRIGDARIRWPPMPPDEVRNWRLGEPRWGGRVGARTVPAARREQPDDLERLAAAESQRWVDGWMLWAQGESEMG